MKRFAHLVLGAVLGVAVASCGGGGSSVAEGGIGGTGISAGSISAFGSIVVNGTRFDVDAAEITVNGQPGTQSDLDIGYVVRVDGDLGDGVAESVRFDASVIGEVDSNSIPAMQDTGTLTIMQQPVRITATTVVVGIASPDQIAAGTRVLVSGFRNSGDDLVATHVEVAPSQAVDQIVGEVTTSGSTSFTIGGLAVDTFLGTPDVGDRVLVRGNYNPGSGRMAAGSVEEVEDIVLAGVEIELEGIVDSFSSNADFTVDGVPVDASAATIVDETGQPATNQIRPDVEVEVEGVFNRSGILVADRVEIELEDNVEIQAPVQTVDPVQGTVGFFPGGSGTLVTASITGKTRLRDGSSQDIENFALDDLVVGDWVELDAFEDSGGTVTALQLERIDTEDKVMVEGPVDSLNPAANVLVILGVVFDTTGLSLSGILPGDIVEVEWDAGAMFMQPMPVDDVEKEN